MNVNRARARAKRIEDIRRERAFLPIGEFINGVEVLPFKLSHLTRLFHARSPFFFGGPVRAGDIGLFVWIVSPHYDHLNQKIRRDWRWLPWRVWMKLRRRRIPRIREAFVAQVLLHPRFPLFHKAINQYIDRAFMDRPPTMEAGKTIETSYAASILHKMMQAYGGEIETWLGTSMVAIFQLLKWVDVEAEPRTPQFTPLQSRIEQTADRIAARTPHPAPQDG